FHKQAHLAAQASMAAHAQGKFWPYHDKLFANYRNLSKANFLKWAKELGLNVAKFKADLDSGKYKAYVDADLASARTAGANGTPTFLINGQKVVGAQPFARFKQVIDAALSGKKAPAPTRARRPRPKAPTGPVKIIVGAAPTWGPKTAKVTLVEFSDFQCPFCTRGAKTVSQLKKMYGNKLRVVFKHQPLSFHKQAHIAAQASMAAHEQGKFWQFHDKLFANNRNLSKANFLKWAKELGLDVAKFKAALDSGKYKTYVDKDKAFASSVGANGTPTFFINGQKLVGAQPLPRFKAMIDAALSGKKVAAPTAPRRPAPGARVKIAIGKSPVLGSKLAKVTIVEFSDFECPFCTRGANTIKKIVKEYGSQVRVVFKHLPLSFHRNAHMAAQASMAAHAQGKFWEFHDKLFANSRNLSKANYLKWAKELGLDVAKFKAALDSGKYKAFVDANAAKASSVGANGTPTFFINGKKLVGAQPFARFKQVIDAELKK
ncbi:MAG: thioredoxin, partial [Deltaproteobacteria bacterium]|nr:thioredoxin [Deltaproteobacteria bacterium]